MNTSNILCHMLKYGHHARRDDDEVPRVPRSYGQGYIYIYIYTYMYVYIYIYIYKIIYVCIYIYICIEICFTSSYYYYYHLPLVPWSCAPTASFQNFKFVLAA